MTEPEKKLHLPLTSDEAAALIDQTLLRPDQSEAIYKQWIVENSQRKFANLFLPPCYVAMAAAKVRDTPTRIGSVIGFPLGFMVRHTKIQALKDLIDRGVDEVDFVVNISYLKSGNDGEFVGELKDLRRYADSRETARGEQVVLKGIIECCYLTEPEKRWAVEHLAVVGIDFVKTSTGLGTHGATVQDVRLLISSAQGRIQVKASGDIRNREDMTIMLKAGATRIGTSHGADIIADYLTMPDM